MAVDELSRMIGDAWDLHRKGDNSAAIRAFEDVLARDEASVDAHYGLGLAKRGAGDSAAAREAFERALALAQQNLDELRAGRSNNDLSTSKDDRYMMLQRMIQQRIAET
jgi:tetratricopeptide (TPR) repeat protein